MSATTERKTVTRVDIEHAIDAREEARVALGRACRGDDAERVSRAGDKYAISCTVLRGMLDRWEDQLRGWGEGA